MNLKNFDNYITILYFIKNIIFIYKCKFSLSYINYYKYELILKNDNKNLVFKNKIIKVFIFSKFGYLFFLDSFSTIILRFNQLCIFSCTILIFLNIFQLNN